MFFSLFISSCTASKPPPVLPIASLATAAWLEHNYGTIEDPELSSYLNGLLQRIVEAAEHRFPAETARLRCQGKTQQAALNWELIVLNSKHPNAFSNGGQQIFITAGLLSTLERESELAAVLAHEIAHELLGHFHISTDAMQSSNKASPVPSVEATLTKELQADSMGFYTLRAAGFETNSALHALVLVYRRFSENVSLEIRALMARRIAELQQLRDKGQESNRYRVESRDFRKMLIRIREITARSEPAY